MSGILNQPSTTPRATALIEIYASINRYAYLARDHLDWEALGKTFTQDAKVHLANGTVISHFEMKNLMPPDKPTYMRHHVTAIDVKFHNDAQALVHVQWFATTDLSQRDHWGEWEDVLVLDNNGGWFIAEKKIKFEGVDPDGVAASMSTK